MPLTARRVSPVSGGGSFIHIAFPGLLDDLQKVADGAPLLAREMLSESVRVAVSVLAGFAADPTWYGVSETIAALQEGAANPIEIISDPAAGIYKYGAGSIVSSTAESSSPPDSIKNFLAYYRAAHPAPTRTRAPHSITPRMVKPPAPRVPRREQRAVQEERRRTEAVALGRRKRSLLDEKDALRALPKTRKNKERMDELEHELLLVRAERFIITTPLPRALIADLYNTPQVEARTVPTVMEHRYEGTRRNGGQLIYNERQPLEYVRHYGSGSSVARAYRAEGKRRGNETLVFGSTRLGRLSSTGRERRANEIMAPNSRLMRGIRALSGERIRELASLVPVAEWDYVSRGRRAGLRRYATTMIPEHMSTAGRARMHDARRAAGPRSGIRPLTTRRPDMRIRGKFVQRMSPPRTSNSGPLIKHTAESRKSARARPWKYVRGSAVAKGRGATSRSFQGTRNEEARMKVKTRAIAPRGRTTATQRVNFAHGITLRPNPASPSLHVHLEPINARPFREMVEKASGHYKIAVGAQDEVTTTKGLRLSFQSFHKILSAHYSNPKSVLAQIDEMMRTPMMKGHNVTLNRILMNYEPANPKSASYESYKAGIPLSGAEIRAGQDMVATMSVVVNSLMRESLRRKG